MRWDHGSERSDDEVLDALMNLVSPRIGVAQNLAPLPARAGAPRISLFAAEAALEGPRTRRISRPHCGGAGLTPRDAKLSALGELLEAYCAAFWREDDLIFGTYDDLRSDHDLVEPERFALFSDRQYERPGFPFRRFGRKAPVAWVRGYSVVRRKEILVPASRVYLPYSLRSGETDIGPVVSTGLGAGSNLTQAILSGLYECLERDAVTIFWMNELRVRRIDVDRSPADHAVRRIFEERFRRKNFEYWIFDITQDLDVPVSFVVLKQGEARGSLYSVGAACRMDGGQAVLKALVEAVQGVPYVQRLIENDPGWQPAPDFSNVTDFSYSARLYTVAPHLTPYLRSLETRVTNDVTLDRLAPWPKNRGREAELEALVDRLRRGGYEAVVVELTTRDIESLGMKVVRVITPELQPLHGDHRFPFLGGARLREVSLHERGREVPDEAFLSRYPHPFP